MNALTSPEGLQALAILQAKIRLKTGGLGCFQNWLYLDHQIRSNFEGAPGGPPGQLRCSQWSQVNVLTGPDGLQAKNSKSVTHPFMSVIKYKILSHLRLQILNFLLGALQDQLGHSPETIEST